MPLESSELRSFFTSRESLSRDCSQLEDTLIHAMLVAANTLLEGQVLSQATLENVSEKNNFVDSLSIQSNAYKRNITLYLDPYLSNDINTPERLAQVLAHSFPANDEDSELAALFRSPKTVMGSAYRIKQHFGLKINDEFFDFDEQLKLLFRIKLLFAASRKSFSLRCVNAHLNALKAEVEEFKQKSLNKDELRQQATSNQPVVNIRVIRNNEVPNNEAPVPYYFLEDDTLDPTNPFGDAYPSIKPWFLYWDPVYGNTPLQMDYAEYYPMSERVMYFILGRGVRKYLKDNVRWLNAGVEIFDDILNTQYHRGFDLDSITLGWMASNLLAMVFNDIPMALLTGILSLPIRLAWSLVNHVFGNNLFTKRFIKPPFELILVLLDIVSVSIQWVLIRAPLSIALLPMRLFIGVTTSVIFSVGMAFARHVIKPFIPSVNKKELATVFFKLRCAIAKVKENNPSYKYFNVDGNVISVDILDAQIKRLRSHLNVSSLIELKDIFKNKRTFAVICSQREDFQPPYISCVFINNKQNSSLANYVAHTNHEVLFLDWNLNALERSDSIKTFNEALKGLRDRKIPLNKLSIVGEHIDDQAISKICSVLIHNVYIQQLEEINFDYRSCTSRIGLQAILNLLENKKSIQRIPSLPDCTDDLDEQSAEILKKIKQCLDERAKTLVAAPTSPLSNAAHAQESKSLQQLERKSESHSLVPQLSLLSPPSSVPTTTPAHSNDNISPAPG